MNVLLGIIVCVTVLAFSYMLNAGDCRVGDGTVNNLICIDKGF